MRKNAETIAFALTSTIENRSEALWRMAVRWRVADGTPESLWRADARSYHATLKGELAIVRTDAAGTNLWVEPVAGNENAVGFSQMSDPFRKAAFERARLTGKSALASDVALPTGGRGFVLMHPLYRNLGQFDGMVVSIYEWQEAIADLVPRSNYEGLELELLARDRVVVRLGARASAIDDSLNVSHPFDILGNEWELRLTASPAYIGEHHTQLPIAVFFVVMTLSILLFMLVRIWGANQERTDELAQLSQDLHLRQSIIDRVAIVAETDAAGVITYANDLFVKTSGYKRHELIGNTHSMMRSGHHDSSFYGDLWRTIRNGKIWRGEIKNIAKSGELLWYDTTIIPTVSAEGNIEKYTAIRFDMTPRMLADLRLREAIDVMESGFALFDAEDRLILYNDAFLDSGTKAKFPNPIGHTFEELFQSFAEGPITAVDALKNPQAWFAWRLDMHRNPPEHPLEIEWTDGRWMRVTERRTEEGGIVGIWTDITEQKLREVTLRQARERLQEQTQRLIELAEEASLARKTAIAANEEKSKFLASMSHELRTPLNSILGFSEMIIGEAFGPLEPPRYREYLADIHESGRHLLSLINDVLDISKVEAGKMILNIDAISPPDLLRQVHSLTIGMAKAKKVELSSSVAPGCSYIEADPRALKQILVNLISNAVKFTPSGGHVSLDIADSGGEAVEFVVRDNGIGMDSEEIQHAFEAYGQVQSDLAIASKGTGLGLPLAKALAELHGGSLTLTSEKGRGTMVRMVIPKSIAATESRQIGVA